MSNRVRITEVGPRDGLQNERAIVSVDDKVKLIDMLSLSGISEIEVSSFVSPKWVPQLADAEEVFNRITRNEAVVYSALVPNERGLERAFASDVDKVSVFTAASETFSQKNTHASIAETMDRFRPVVAAAHQAGLPVRAYISCIVKCPYEGAIETGAVRDVTLQLLELGVDEIDLGETMGVATPDEIEAVYAVLDGTVAPGETTLHLHDTFGRATDCARRAMELGVSSFDGSCGGIGGCPYAPGASGNIATERLVELCGETGKDCGVKLGVLREAGEFISAAVMRAGE